MRTLGWLFALALWGTAAQIINFDSAKPGTVPPGWTAVPTLPGVPPKWEVIRDPTAPSPPYVFAQASRDTAGGHCPLAILDKVSVKDGELSVRMKPVAGKEYRAAGIVWRQVA